MTFAAPASVGWFARHELSLAWRDALAMMTGGRPRRTIVLLVVLLGAAVLLHLMAQAFVGPWAAAGIGGDKHTLVVLTASGFLFLTVMLSQSLESVTRAYYTRSDLDLILSSPASAQKVFVVRTGIAAMGTMLLACLIASPLVDMLIVNDGPRWFAAYGVLAGMGALASALGVAMTVGLFHLVGPKRTRLIAQIVAAIIGAGFVIGIQAVAIVSYGSLSRFEVLESPEFTAAMPDAGSLLYLPARAAMGDLPALLGFAILCLGLLGATVALAAPGFSRFAVAAASVSSARTRRTSRASFRPGSQRAALRRKEWLLLRRDPWLLSQTLMQILYLLPPALMLWLNYGASAGVFVVVVPVLVMASGQLAGGLAWLAISGEDAADLVATAPVTPRTVLVAKIEAVTVSIAIVLAPLLALMALSSWEMALVTAGGAALSAGSATTIQLWFRRQARRSMFRRRQVSSRVATIAEAFVSIMWAGAAALVASGIAIIAVVPAVLAMLVLLIVWAIRPRAA